MENTLAKWLESHELSKYQEVLLSNDIDTIELVKSLSQDDLKELGVSLGDRKRFEKAFQDNGKSFTDFEKEVISQYPYVIAYPFKRMLEEEDGRNRLELMAYSFLNLMKYLGLVLASEYFHSPVRSRELNELFRNNLYQPSFGNWNAFIREAIKVLSAQELNWIFPALKDAYTLVEIKNPKKYKVESEYTDEDGLLKWRQSDLTSIGALINFRNRYLGHGMPLSKEEYAALYQTIYPIYTDLLTAFACLKDMQMIKSDRLNQYLLQGDEVQVLPKTHGNQADLIWIQQNEGQVLPLIPFYIIPGKFNAGHTDKTQVLVYEQNTGQRMVFYSPESIKAEATGEILERLQLLLENKEREEPYTKESFTAERFHDRLRISNDKVLQGLKKERKVIEGTYQSRGEAEIALMGWTGAVSGFFFLAAEAGSGKTNLLVHVAERYQALEFPTLLLRGNRMEHANLHQEICSQLNIPPDADLTEYGIVGNREKPFMILLDGANEHPASLELLASAAALADAYPGGGLKVVVSWRVNHLDQVPDCTFKDIQTLFNAGDRQHPKPLAAAAHLLKPMNLVEVEGAWKHYANHPSKLFRPQFGYDELVLADKPLVDQFSNPLLLRLFMEIFHNKGLKSKPKGFTNLWKLWWQRISEQAGEADYLQQLAALLAETRSLQVPLDRLFDHPELSRSVNNLQVDSPHQQLLRKGVISQYFHDGVLQVSFTMEAACQYVLSLSLEEGELSTRVKADSFWEGPVRFRLWDSVYDVHASLLFDLIDDEDFPNALAGFALAQFVLLHGPEKALNRLLENPSAHDWEVLLLAFFELEINRPIEHVKFANYFLRSNVYKLDESTKSLFVYLIQFGEKEISDNIYKSLLLIYEVLNWEDKLKLSLYLIKYGRIDAALNVLENLYSNFHFLDCISDSHKFSICIHLAKLYLEKCDFEKSISVIESIELLIGNLNNEEAQLLNLKGEFFEKKSNYIEAFRVYIKSLELNNKRYGIFHEKTLQIIANLFRLFGHTELFVKLLNESHEAAIKYLGEDNKICVKFSIYKSLIEKFNGRFNESIILLNTILEKAHYILGEIHLIVAEIYMYLADNYRYIEQYKSAQNSLESALKIRITIYGKNHPEVAELYSLIGEIYHTQEDFVQALDYFSKSFEIRNYFFENSHISIAHSYDEIGSVYLSESSLDKAKSYFQMSLEIKEEILPKNHMFIAKSFDNIGDVLNFQEDYIEAIKFYEKSLTIRKISLGEGNFNLVYSYDRIANIYESISDFNNALKYYEFAYTLSKNINHIPFLIDVTNKMGKVFLKTNVFHKAIEFFNLQLELSISINGELHTDVASILENIGNIYKGNANFNEALAYFERAMAIDLQYYGESHPNVGWSRVRLGEIFQKQDQLDKAITEFTISLEIMEKSYGNESRDAAKVKRRIGFVKVLMGQVEEGIGLINQSIETLNSTGLEKDVSLAISFMNLSTGYRLQNNLSSALSSIQLAIEIFHENRGAFHIDTAEAYVEYAHILQAMGNVAAAQSHFQKSYEIRLTKLGEAHPDTIQSASLLNKP